MFHQTFCIKKNPHLSSKLLESYYYELNKTCTIKMMKKKRKEKKNIMLKTQGKAHQDTSFLNFQHCAPNNNQRFYHVVVFTFKSQIFLMIQTMEIGIFQKIDKSRK